MLKYCIISFFAFTLALSATNARSKVLLQDFDAQMYPSIDMDFTVALKIVGDISDGTFDELTSKHAESVANGESAIVLLDSNGGLVAEALKIAGFVSGQGLTTLVEANAHCYSACAFVFMAGRHPPTEGPGWVSRYLDIRGKLGFHAPYLPYGADRLDERFEGTYRDILKAYQTSLTQIGTLLGGPVTTGTQWPPSLVGETLLTPPDKFRKIDTIDDAGRWHIELLGFADTQLNLDAHARYITCMNYFRWSDEEVWHEYRSFDFWEPENVSGWSSQQESQVQPDPSVDVIYAPIDELNVLGCYFKIFHSENTIWIAKDASADEQPVTKMMTYRPNTRLDDIAAEE